MREKKKRYGLQNLLNPLTAVIFVAFVLRTAPICYLEWQEPGWHANNIDEVEFYYDDVARSLIVGEGFVHSANPRPGSPIEFESGTPFHYVPPLYAWWVGLVYFCFGPNIVLAKLLQCLMDACVCPLLYLLARRVTSDTKTALIAGALYAIYPMAIWVNRHLFYQIPLNLALIWIILCLMAPLTWRNGLWAGAAVGISALAKPVTLPLLVAIPVVRFLESTFRRDIGRACFIWCFCFVVAFSATLAPWIIRNYMVFHHFVPVQNGGGITMFNGSKEGFIDLNVVEYRKVYKEEIEAAGPDYQRAAIDNHATHFRNAPLDYFRFLGKKFLFAWYNTESKSKNRLSLIIQTPFLLLAILGLICAPRLWLKGGNWYIPGAALYFGAIGVAFNPFLRYTIAVMPLVMIIAAVGGRWLIRMIEIRIGLASRVEERDGSTTPAS